MLQQVCSISRCLHTALLANGDPCEAAMRFLRVTNNPSSLLYFSSENLGLTSESHIFANIARETSYRLALLSMLDVPSPVHAAAHLSKVADCSQAAEQQRQRQELLDSLLNEYAPGGRPQSRGLAIATGRRDDFDSLVSAPS